MTQPLVWTIRDRKKLQREFELLCASAVDPRREAEALCRRFRTWIRRYPADWTVESRRPSEHVWTFGRAQVRYRIIPDAEAVEILSVNRSESGEADSR
jgi:hypothetical protein